MKNSLELGTLLHAELTDSAAQLSAYQLLFQFVMKYPAVTLVDALETLNMLVACGAVLVPDESTSIDKYNWTLTVVPGACSACESRLAVNGTCVSNCLGFVPRQPVSHRRLVEVARGSGDQLAESRAADALPVPLPNPRRSRLRQAVATCVLWLSFMMLFPAYWVCARVERLLGRFLRRVTRYRKEMSK